MFRKMRGLPEFPAEQYGAGDVLSHLTASLDVDGVRLTMLPNPSHLEAVNPVAAGKARAREMRAGRGQYGSERVGEGALCVQVHGDGALAGQGVNQETLQLSQVPHYAVGGSLHLVVNNQVAFTAPGERGRSSTHCTGLARQIEAPVIHVNGDRPEEVVKATRLAMEYRQKFRKDVFVDLVCFRRWGHKHKSTSILSLFLDAYVWDVNYTRLSRLGRSFEISFAICLDFGSLCTATMCTEHTHIEDFSPPSVAINATGGHHLA